MAPGGGGGAGGAVQKDHGILVTAVWLQITGGALMGII